MKHIFYFLWFNPGFKPSLMPCFGMLGLFEPYVAGSPHGFVIGLVVVNVFWIKAQLLSANIKLSLQKKKSFSSSGGEEKLEDSIHLQEPTRVILLTSCSFQAHFCSCVCGNGPKSWVFKCLELPVCFLHTTPTLQFQVFRHTIDFHYHWNQREHKHLDNFSSLISSFIPTCTLQSRLLFLWKQYRGQILLEAIKDSNIPERT